MDKLTPEQREALMADMRSFFDHDQFDEDPNDVKPIGNKNNIIDHRWDDMSK